MNLITRCPSCGTAFRVQPVQLSARGGKVRCGKCGAIFNGVAALVEQGSAPASIEPSPQLGLFEAARRAAPGSEALSFSPALPPSVDPAPGASPVPDTVLTEAAAPEFLAAPAEPMKDPSARMAPAAPERAAPQPAAPPRPAAQQAAPPRAVAAPQAGPPPEFLAEARPRLRFTVVWALLALIAAAGLALQVALFWRSDIAARFPQARPALAALCLTLDCRLHLPRRPDLMSIESSDLQADAQRDNVIVLNATLRNRAAFPQEYPSLELTLTDEQDRPVVRRVLSPREYLPGGAVRLRQGIPAGGDAVAHVYFDTSRVRATGYRIYLFYP